MTGIVLTPEQVVERTGIAKQTLANWRAMKTGPSHFKVGRLVRYWETDVDAWLLAQSEATAS
jgi:predicted DNA-binding transcriptional regulator AlpA